MKPSQSAGSINLKSRGVEFPAPLVPQKKVQTTNKFKKNWLIYTYFCRKVCCFFFLNSIIWNKIVIFKGFHWMSRINWTKSQGRGSSKRFRDIFQRFIFFKNIMFYKNFVFKGLILRMQGNFSQSLELLKTCHIINEKNSEFLKHISRTLFFFFNFQRIL